MMETKSFSCKIRNNVSEISFIESLLYKYHFKCKLECLNKFQNPNKCLSQCEEKVDKIFLKYSDSLSTMSAEHKVCMIKCTDKLNFPSEELTCYDKCEEGYLKRISDMKEKLFKDFEIVLNKN